MPKVYRCFVPKQRKDFKFVESNAVDGSINNCIVSFITYTKSSFVPLEYTKVTVHQYRRLEKSPSFSIKYLLYLQEKYELSFVDKTGFETKVLLTQKDLPIKAQDQLIMVWDENLPIAFIDGNREYFMIYPNTFSELHFSGQYNWRYLMIYTIIAMFAIGISAELNEIKIPTIVILVPLVFYSLARFLFVAMNARLNKTIENEIVARFAP